MLRGLSTLHGVRIGGNVAKNSLANVAMRQMGISKPTQPPLRPIMTQPTPTAPLGVREPTPEEIKMKDTFFGPCGVPQSECCYHGNYYNLCNDKHDMIQRREKFERTIRNHNFIISSCIGACITAYGLVLITMVFA